MDNSTILNQIVNEQEKVVFKGMRADMESGKALLNPEQLGQFLREAQLNTTIMKAADFRLMRAFKLVLSRVGIDGKVLESGYKEDNKTTNPDINPANVKFGANELDAKKLKAVCEITDDEKEDNLEQQQFERTLLSMMGERIGEDLEYWAVFADTAINREDNNLLSTADGWIKKSGTKIQSEGQKTAIGSGKAAFDITADSVEAMFDAMIYAMPPRFRQNRNNLVLYVPFEVEDAYRNLLKSRGTNLGDSTQTGFNQLTYKSIPVIHAGVLDDEVGKAIDNTATSFLTNPKNLVWGIWENLSVEPQRIPQNELTKYWYRLRGDINLYFNEATVSAKITKDEAEELPAQSKA